MFVKGLGPLLAAVSAGLAVLTATAPQADARGGDKAYTIANYPVDASDSNAVKAKDKALSDGQTAALRSLLMRIVPVTAYKQLATVAGLDAGNLVSGVAVRSERNSATRYLANLDYSFSAEAVRGELTRLGIPFVDEQAEQVTVITAWRQGNPPTTANDKGPWRRSWAALDLVHSVTPVRIEDLRPEIHADTIDMLLTGNDNGLRILSGEYLSNRVVLAVAEPDTSSGKLTVTLAGEDAVGPLLLKRIYRIPQGDLAYATELAAVVSLGILEGRWKALKSPGGAATTTAAAQPAWAAAPDGGDPVSLTVEFASPGEWNEIRAQLLDTPGIGTLDVTTVTDTNAIVALTYPGGARGLANALGGRGLTLRDPGTGLVLRRGY